MTKTKTNDKHSDAIRRSEYADRCLVAQRLFKQIGFISKETEQGTNKIGYTNSNRQVCLGTRKQPGTDHNAYSYAMFCLDCGKVYGANGTDVGGAGAGQGIACHYCRGRTPDKNLAF